MQDLMTEMYDLDKELGIAFFYYYTEDYDRLDTQVSSLLLNVDRLESTIEDTKMDQIHFDLNVTRDCLVLVKSDLHSNNYKNAFYDLDRFRYKLIGFRSENNIEYAIDYLWDIEALIEIAHSSIIAKTDCTIDWYELTDLSLCLKTDFYQFQTLLEKHQDVSGIHMQDSYFKIYTNNFQYSINEFEDAVLDTNWKSLKAATKQLNRDYLNLLHNISFGDTENYAGVN